MTATTPPAARQTAALNDCGITRRMDRVIDEIVRRDADRARAALDAQKVAR